MPRRSAARRLLALVAAVGATGAAAVAVAPSASAATPVRFERIAGVASPGTPARLDRVGILRVGARSAPNVLVLNPGTSASAAYFQPLARSIVRRARDWQVWAVERRENLLEDHAMLDRGKAGTATPRQVFDYYLGYLDDPSITDHFRFIPDSEVAYAKRWGMEVEIGDLRTVVARATRQAEHVVVGGHSLGGTIATAYATWDFGGRAGAEGLDGLVLIDGASRTEAITADQARQSLADLEAGSPWLTFGGIPAPFTGLFNASGALGVKTDPDSPSLGQRFSLLPAELKPPVPATNAAQYGFALDSETSPPALIAAQAHLGHLAESGDPRGWVSDELTPLERFADMFAGWGLQGLDGTAWYHPMRLTIDAGAVANGNANPAQEVLDVAATHGADLPRHLRIYAFGAQLGGQRVLDAARALAAQSGIPARNLTLVDRAATYAHNDPNSAYPRNAFLRRLVPFLETIGKQPARLHVLVTNDDGVAAPGIDRLVRALRRRDDVRVTVVAPAEQQTGSGGASTSGPLDGHRTTTRSGVPAWAVEGYPADAVRYALDTVLRDDPPDLVIAGINEGANLSPVYDRSGTVGAARAAARRGFPALATSQGRMGPGLRTRFRDGVRLTLRWLEEHRDRLRPGVATSLNTPGCTRGRVRAIVPARPAPAGVPRPPRHAVDCTRPRTPFAHDVDAFRHGYAPVAWLPLEPRT